MGLLAEHVYDTTPGNKPKADLVDMAPHVALWGAATMHFGTAAVVFIQTMVKQQYTRQVASTFAGFGIMIGSALFWLSSVVSGTVEETLGGFVLCMAMVGYFLSLLLEAANGEPYDDGVSWLLFASLVVALIGVSIMAKKGYERLRRPWLGHKNYFFYGVIAFGTGVSVFLFLTLRSLDVSEDDTLHDGGEPFGALCLASGALLLMLYASRGSYCLDTVLADRYPCTSYLHNTLSSGIVLWGCALCLASRIWVVIVRLLGKDWHWNIGDAKPWLATGDIILGMGSLLLTVSMKKKVFKYFSALLAIAAFARAVSIAVGEQSRILTIVDREVEVGESFCAGISGMVCVFAQFFLALYVAKVGFLMRRVLHPGNYYFIAVASCAVGDLLQSLAAFGIGSLTGYGVGTNLSHIGACISVLGSIFLPLHAGMVCEVAAIASFEGFEYEEDPGWSACAATPNDESPEDWEREDLKEIEVEVLICGGGPVGLANANELGLLNVKTLLVEERQSVIPDPRFFVLNCQSMEGLSRLGLVDQVKELGCPQDVPFGAVLTNGLAHSEASMQASACVPGRDYCQTNTPNLSDVECSRFVGSRHAMLQPQRIMQAHQERVLKTAGEARESVNILYGHRLVKFREVGGSNGGYVQALVQPLGDDGIAVGRRLLVRAQYILGCDGPGGPVARSLGFKYDGFANVTNTQSCLFESPQLTEHVRKNIGLANQYQVARPGVGVGILVHVDPVKGLWNFVGRWLFDPKHFKNNEECVREFIGAVDFKIVLEGHWYWNFFIARSFLKGRAILCGDSAHSWPPVCGLGGNTGYGDSVNLGWKLAAVLKGWGGKGLLESYSIERRTAALYAAQMVMLCTPRPSIMLLLCRMWTKLEKVCPPLLRVLRWKWKYGNSGHHSGQHHCQAGLQLGTRYDLSPICITEKVIPADDPFVTYYPRISAGARLPFCPLSDGTPIFDALSLDGYTLLVLASEVPSDLHQSPPTSPESSSKLQDLTDTSPIVRRASKKSVGSQFAAAKEETNSACQESVIGLVNAFAAIGAPLKLLDLSGSKLSISTKGMEGAHRECARLYRKEALVLVRPDRVTVWHLPLQNCAKPMPEHEALKIAEVCTGHVGVSEKAAALCSLRWLTSRFLFSLRPFGFAFPQALPLQNQTKEEAIAILRAKKDSRYEASKTKMRTVDQERERDEPSALSEGVNIAMSSSDIVGDQEANI